MHERIMPVDDMKRAQHECRGAIDSARAELKAIGERIKTQHERGAQCIAPVGGVRLYE